MAWTRQRVVRREEPRKGQGGGLAWACGLSVGIHLCLALLFQADWIEFGEPLPADPPIPVEMVFLEAESVEPETPVEAADSAELEVPPEPEPEMPVETAKLEPVEESPAEPEVAPEPEPDVPVETAEPEPAEESPAEPEVAPEPPPQEALEAAEAIEPLPEAAPVVAAQEAEPSDPAEPAAAPEPPVIPTPVPRVKPVLAQQPTAPPEAEAQPEPQQEEVASEPPPEVVEVPAVAAPANPEPAYRSRSDIGRVTPEQLLANLAAVADESLQAEKNPELWAVIRLLRRQIKQCWLYDSDEDIDDRYAVDIAVAFRRNGAVDRAEVEDVARMVADSDYDRFVRRARKALLACGPFDLPAESYGIWRSFTMRFVLRDAS